MTELLAGNEDDPGAVIDRFYRALTAGDVAGARACCTADALFWHCFDGIAQDLDEASLAWAGLGTSFAEMRVQDVRRSVMANGRIVHQQWFVARKRDGAPMGWAVCLLVDLRDGLIARIDEYIDRAGPLAVPAPDARIPGLDPG